MSFKARFKDIPEPVNIEDDLSERVISIDSNDTGMEDDLFLKLSDKVLSVPVWFDYTEDERLAIVNSFIDTYSADKFINLSLNEKEDLSKKILAKLYGFGPIDVLISSDNISSVYVSGGSVFSVDKSGESIARANLALNVETLCHRLLAAAGIVSDGSVFKFSYKNLMVIIVRPPVGQYYILIKKKSRAKTDFAYLLEKNKIDDNIYAFFEYMLNSKKNILISGTSDCGKTSYINAIFDFINDTALFQNTKVLELPSYICGDLSNDEFENLISAISFSRPDYMLFDLNSGYSFDYIYGGVISTIRAESVFDAITKISANEMCHRKITEKQAKAYIAKSFNYIVQLDQDLMLSSVAEFSLNKAGSLVLKEILKLENGHYSYDFPKLENQNDVVEKDVSIENTSSAGLGESFKSRFV